MADRWYTAFLSKPCLGTIKICIVVLCLSSVLLLIVNDNILDARQRKLNDNIKDVRQRKLYMNVDLDYHQAFRVISYKNPAENIKKTSPKSNMHKYGPLPTPGNLKRVRGFGMDVIPFSAIIGNSSQNASWDKIVIQAWEAKNLTNFTFGCCIQYASGVFVSVNMTQKVHWAYRLKSAMAAKQYVCPNTRNLTDPPVGVTISGNLPRNKCHNRFNWYLKPQYVYRHPGKVAVCTKLAFGNLSADDIISWFEIHRRLGVDKVVTFTHDLNPTATRVLQYYEYIGLVEIIPFLLPKPANGRQNPELGVKNMQAWNDEQVPVFDCSERLKGYKYMAIIDLDEYLIPKKDKDLNQLFDRLFKSRPEAAGFTFLVQLHVTSWKPANKSSQFKVGQYLDRTEPMTDRMKHVTMPERITQGGEATHQFTPKWELGYKRRIAPRQEAIIHHFRSCRNEWKKKKSTINCHNITRYRDTTLADIMAKIEPQVLELRNDILNNTNT